MLLEILEPLSKARRRTQSFNQFSSPLFLHPPLSLRPLFPCRSCNCITIMKLRYNERNLPSSPPHLTSQLHTPSLKVLFKLLTVSGPREVNAPILWVIYARVFTIHHLGNTIQQNQTPVESLIMRKINNHSGCFLKSSRVDLHKKIIFYRTINYGP